MPKQQIVPLFGTATFGKSTTVTAQRRINLYAELFQDPDKTPRAYYGRPGLVNPITKNTDLPFSSYTPGIGPIRGMIRYRLIYQNPGYPIGDFEFVVMVRGNKAARLVQKNWQIGFSTNTLRTSDGPVAMADNGFQIMAVDGVAAYFCDYSAGYYGFTDMLADPVTYPDAPNGATSVTFIASRFVFNVPLQPGRFAWSDLNAVTFNALDYATAETSPDPLVAVWESRGELLLFGESTTEFWAPSTGTEVFARIGGAALQWGLAARETLANHNTGCIFLGRNKLGSAQVVMVQGYQGQVISTPDIEHLIGDEAQQGQATAYTMTTVGHSFYVLNLSNKTLVYDLTTGIWAEWQTEDEKFAGKYGIAAYGGFLVSDYRNGGLWRVDETRHTDGDAPIVRELISRHAFVGLNQMTLWRMQLDIEVGVGLNEGQGSDPQVMLQVSKDGGHTWGSEKWRTIGAQGKYLERVVWRSLGSADDWAFRWRIADPVKVALMNCAVEFGE